MSDHLQPNKILSELEDRLLLGQYEQSDYERLRDKVLTGLTRLHLPSPLTASQVSPELVDKSRAGYLYVADDRKLHHAHGGFGGGFYIGREPVSQGAFFEFLQATEYDFPKDLSKWLADKHAMNDPMRGVNWYDARAYCRWMLLQTGEFYDLPFEEEWRLAGETLAPSWPQSIAASGAAASDPGHWLPPGSDEVGSMLDGPVVAPGHTGIMWEWCNNWIASEDDSHLICSGVWPSVEAKLKGKWPTVKMLNHAWPGRRRIGTAGFRMICMPRSCLRSSHRGVLGVTRHICPVNRYLADAVNDPQAPGGRLNPGARPIFLERLPMELRERVETVLSMSRTIDLMLDQLTPGHPAYLDGLSRDIPAPPVVSHAEMNITQIHPLTDRRPVDPPASDELDRERLRIAREIIAADSLNQPASAKLPAPPVPLSPAAAGQGTKSKGLKPPFPCRKANYEAWLAAVRAKQAAAAKFAARLAHFWFKSSH